jgi:hypothetical protein
MSRSLFQRILDGTTSIAVLAVCILILAEAVKSFPPSLAGDNAPASARLTSDSARLTSGPARLAPGDHLEPIAGLDLARSPRTLVMAVQSSCHFCSESMAFYRELSLNKSAGVRLVVVAPDEPAAAKAYVDANRFTPDAILSADLPSIRVTGTPTLLLVNPAGVIERVWMGKLSAAREKEVRDVLAEVTR